LIIVAAVADRSRWRDKEWNYKKKTRINSYCH